MSKRIDLIMSCLFVFSIFVFGIDLSWAQEAELEEGVRTCGLAGTIQERISDCAKPIANGGFGSHATRRFNLRDHLDDQLDEHDDYDVNDWRLVTRTEDKLQFWMSERTGMIWSDVSHDGMPHNEAQSFCSEMTEIFNGSETFRLPTLSEFDSAHWEGLFSILASSRRGGYVWTSTKPKDEKDDLPYTYVVWEEFGLSGLKTNLRRYPYDAQARCVAE